MQIYSECRLRTKHYDKIYVFNFRRVTFQFIYSNNQAATAYAVYDLVNRYRISESQMTMDMFHLS